MTPAPRPVAHRTLTPVSKPRPKRDVDRIVVARGERQWIQCKGTGSPTIVLVAGAGANESVWSGVLPRLRRLARTCVYDRPGIGQSPHRYGTKTVNAGLHASELRALLTAAGETGPFIMVGHSYGGLIVRAFTQAYPRAVSGVMLAEGVYPGIEKDYWAPYRHNWHEVGTVIDLAASARATGNGPHLGARPMVVITAANPEPGAPAWVVRLWNRHQRQSAWLSTNSVHVVALYSGHLVPRDQPSVIVEGLRELVRAVRAAGKVPKCSPAWAVVGARCLAR